MSLTVCFCRKGIATLLTVKRSLARVSSHVTNHQTFFEGAIVADFALIGLNFDVLGFLVLIQIVLSEETIGAQFTMVAALLDWLL